MTSKFLIVAILFINTSFAKERVKIKYKKFEKFDLGDMEIEGEIVAPGDLTVRERKTRFFERDLYDREEYDKEVMNELR